MARKGGGKLAQIFRVKADMSIIYSGLSGTGVASSPDDAAFIIGGDVGNDILVQTDINYDVNSVPTVKFTQLKSGSDFQKFADCFFPRKTGTSSSNKTEEFYSQSGKHIGGDVAASDQELALLMLYGALDDDSEIGVSAYVGYFGKDSGGKTFVNGKFVSPPINFTAIAALTVRGIGTGAPDTGLIISSELLDNTIVTPDDDLEIEPEYYETTVFLAAA